MQFKVYRVKRKTKLGKSEKEGYMMKMRSQGIIEPEQLSEEMSRYLSLEGPEILTAINQLYALIAREVMMGMSVKIDGLGTFYPKLTAKGVATKEDCDASTIRKFSVGFRIDKKFQQEMDKVKIVQDYGVNQMRHI